MMPRKKSISARSKQASEKESSPATLKHYQKIDDLYKVRRTRSSATTAVSLLCMDLVPNTIALKALCKCLQLSCANCYAMRALLLSSSPCRCLWLHLQKAQQKQTTQKATSCTKQNVDSKEQPPHSTGTPVNLPPHEWYLWLFVTSAWYVHLSWESMFLPCISPQFYLWEGTIKLQLRTFRLGQFCLLHKIYDGFRIYFFCRAAERDICSDG